MTILNMFASVTSADSVTEHIEEPCEVPESSMSSIFFQQEQCLVILKQYTLKGATSRILHLEKAGKFFQVGHPKSILISLIHNHPCLGLVYCYFFDVFLP